MASKSSAQLGADPVPTTDRPESIRNVVLVGPAGSGKTTLVEALLTTAGVIGRAGRVEEGTTVSDFDDAEIRQQRSVGLSLAPLLHNGVKINLLDTPGYADFVGELRAGLRAADCAMFVIAANEGVDVPTREVWRECAAVGMPRVVVVTKLDHARADYDAVVAGAQAAFGEKVVPAYLHENDQMVGLLTGDDPAHEEQRRALIEAVIEESEDETLMERYVGGEAVDRDLLVKDLERAVARGSFFPVVPVCSSTGLGTTELLDLVVSGFPSPPEHALPEVFTPEGKRGPEIACDPDGPLVAEVVKTSTDPYVGRVSLVRVFSGTIRPDMTVHVSGHFSSFFGEQTTHEDHDEDERIGVLSVPLGKQQRPVELVVAGDLCTIGRLSRAETGDTLSDKDQPLVLKPWNMPEPLLPVAVQAHAKADEDKLSSGLQRLAAEDPTLRVEHNPETHQLVLWCLGEAHVDVALERLANRYGATVDQVPLRVPLRETFAGLAKGHGRHVKQSGGHGQFAVCDIEVEPLPEGSGFEFVDKVVGGAVPRQFIPSVEKGVLAQMEKGVANGYPVVDIRVTLTDGKAHPVDSSDMAFQTAGALALREAAAATKIAMLEPVDEVSVIVPDDLVGTVMSDLSGRRGRVLGSESVGDDRTLVRAEVPQVEIVRYAVDLRSFSHGTASFSRTFVRYEPMPANVAERYLKED
ncbi:elongation factor G-like protein EF-G2 [Nocardioides pakistanensis]